MCSSGDEVLPPKRGQIFPRRGYASNHFAVFAYSTFLGSFPVSPQSGCPQWHQQRIDSGKVAEYFSYSIFWLIRFALVTTHGSDTALATAAAAAIIITGKQQTLDSLSASSQSSEQKQKTTFIHPFIFSPRAVAAPAAAKAVRRETTGVRGGNGSA